MNSKTIKKELLVLFLTLSLALSGCGSSKTKPVVDQLPEEQTEEPKEPTIETNEGTVGTSAIVVADQASTQAAVTYFDDTKNEIGILATGNDKEVLQEIATEYLTTAVDFIFNGEELNGVTYDELTDTSKEAITESIETTNEILSDSGIKGIVIEGKDKATVWTFDKLHKVLGEEEYDKAAIIVEDAKTKVLTTYEGLKEKLSDNK